MFTLLEELPDDLNERLGLVKETTLERADL